MGMWIGRNRKARVTYGFDEIALVPGEITINPNEVDTSFEIPCPGGRATYRIQPQARVLVEIAPPWNYRKTAGVYPSLPGAVWPSSGEALPTDPDARRSREFWGWAVFLPVARRTTHGK